MFELDEIKSELPFHSTKQMCGSCGLTLATHACDDCAFSFCYTCVIDRHTMSAYQDHVITDIAAEHQKRRSEHAMLAVSEQQQRAADAKPMSSQSNRRISTVNMEPIHEEDSDSWIASMS